MYAGRMKTVFVFFKKVWIRPIPPSPCGKFLHNLFFFLKASPSTYHQNLKNISFNWYESPCLVNVRSLKRDWKIIENVDNIWNCPEPIKIQIYVDVQLQLNSKATFSLNHFLHFKNFVANTVKVHIISIFIWWLVWKLLRMMSLGSV